MGYGQYTVPDDRSCRTYFCCFPLALENTFPWPFVPILSNFFEEQRTQNHPQCLSGPSHALFPTTFLEIAVNKTFSGSGLSFPDTQFCTEMSACKLICSNQFYPCMFVCLFFYELISYPSKLCLFCTETFALHLTTKTIQQAKQL